MARARKRKVARAYTMKESEHVSVRLALWLAGILRGVMPARRRAGMIGSSQ